MYYSSQYKLPAYTTECTLQTAVVHNDTAMILSTLSSTASAKSRCIYPMCCACNHTNSPVNTSVINRLMMITAILTLVQQALECHCSSSIILLTDWTTTTVLDLIYLAATRPMNGQYGSVVVAQWHILVQG
eukprot:18526-Heterococcus_DN1.PRE.1